MFGVSHTNSQVFYFHMITWLHNTTYLITMYVPVHVECSHVWALIWQKNLKLWIIFMENFSVLPLHSFTFPSCCLFLWGEITENVRQIIISVYVDIITLPVISRHIIQGLASVNHIVLSKSLVYCKKYTTNSTNLRAYECIFAKGKA